MSSTRLDLLPLALPRADDSLSARRAPTRPPTQSPTQSRRPSADRGVWLGYLLLWIGPFAAFLAAVLLTPAR